MSSDEDLALTFQAGDRAAFDTLFERYREPIWAFFRRRTADPADAEELAQETFLALLQASRRYEPRASFRSYLFGIAFNVLSVWRRKARRAPADAGGAAVDAVPAASADPAATIWIRGALDALDPADRDILMLREYDALSYAEIAALVHVPVNTVRSRLFRARLALRERLVGQPSDVGGRR
ncbi:MAG TPA: sigma-70 family RNA polymerase sigma factor [Vicinamibacterales bacterium]|nr:sigma-70 family RNA polymerase sigma factor [Vicinamibacterales bacterium]